MRDERNVSPASAFVKSLDANAATFGVVLDDHQRAVLSDYFELVAAWNKRLHLVAPCSPEEFATRHVLESLCALPHLPQGARVVDVGSGAGLPVIPCLVARPDLKAVLYEASAKKAVFLREALRRVNRHDAATVESKRFEDTAAPEADIVTCRALDRFTELLPTLLDWSPPSSTLLLFGGPAIRDRLEIATRSYTAVLIPNSEQRFIFVIKPAQDE